MREYFLAQLEDSTPISEEKILKLKGKSLNSDYEIGDKRLWFLFQGFMNVNEKTVITMTMKCVVERELDFLEENYRCIRVSNNIPILEKKNTEVI